MLLQNSEFSFDPNYLKSVKNAISSKKMNSLEASLVSSKLLDQTGIASKIFRIKTSTLIEKEGLENTYQSMSFCAFKYANKFYGLTKSRIQKNSRPLIEEDSLKELVGQYILDLIKANHQVTEVHKFDPKELNEFNKKYVSKDGIFWVDSDENIFDILYEIPKISQIMNIKY